MRTTARPRRELHPAAFVALRPALRYSYSRSAWVLVGVGGRFGPVLRPRDADRALDRSQPPARIEGRRFERE